MITDKPISKREQANYDFLKKIQTRNLKAILSYFYTYGICVGQDDILQAIALPQHTYIFSQLKNDLDIIDESINLIIDIGSIPLVAKHKTMQSIYRVEKTLLEMSGDITGLEDSLIEIYKATISSSTQSNYELYIIFGSLLIISGLAWLPFAFIGIVIFLVGAIINADLKQKKLDSNCLIAEANAKLDSIITNEITPRDKAAFSLIN